MESDREFTIDAEKTAPHWLELKGHYKGTPKEVWMRVQAKWDGCVHLVKIYNAPEGCNKPKPDDSDYIHICDIDEFIADLQEIKRLAQIHFAGQHGGEYWKAPEPREHFLDGSCWCEPVVQGDVVKHNFVA